MVGPFTLAFLISIITSITNSQFTIVDVTMNQPLLADISPTSTFDATLAETLGLTSWLMKVPLISWSNMKVVSTHGQAPNFEAWFNDLLNVLNTIATTLSVPRQTRLYAKHLRDYNNFQKCALEEYWLKAHQESPEPCDSHDSPFSTPPGTQSLYLNNKSKYHENYETPENIKRHIMDIKLLSN